MNGTLTKLSVKIAGEKFYLWVCIDSETRFVLSWNLNKSQGI